MAYIFNSLFSPPEDLSILEQFQWKKERIGITEKLEIEKLFFAYFLDHKRFCSNEQKEIDQLTYLNFFSSPLSAKRFYLELKDFLESSSSSLSLDAKIALKNFLCLLVDAQNQNALVDLARSKNPINVILAVNGLDFSFLDCFKVSPKIITDLTELSLRRIDQLKQQESALFLSGSLTHETQIVVTQEANGKWRVVYYDTLSHIIIYQFNENTIKDPSFWNALWSFKFVNSLSDTQATKECLSSRCETKKDTSMKDMGIRVHQHKQTCHFRSLLFVAKELFYNSFDDKKKASKEWRCFKELFGKFLLANKKTLISEKIHTLAEQSQVKRTQKVEIDSDEASCEKAYKEACEILNIDASQLTTLPLHRFQTFFLRTLNKRLIHPDDLKKMLHAQMSNPAISQSVSLFEKEFHNKLELFHSHLAEESSSFFGNIVETTRFVVFKALGYDIKINQKANDDRLVVALEKELVSKYLLLFKRDPRCLFPLSDKPCFSLILLQALQYGMFQDVADIYKKLSENERSAFNIKLSESNILQFKQLPESEKNCLIHFADMPYMSCFFTQALQKAIKNEAIELVLQVINKFPNFKSKIIIEHMREQYVKKESLLKILFCIKQLRIKDAVFRQRVFNLIRNGLLRIQNEITVEELEPYNEFQEIKKVIIILQGKAIYEKGIWNELIPLQQNDFARRELETVSFSFNVSQENFSDVVLNGLKNLQMPILGHVVSDLLTYAYSCNSHEMVLQVFEQQLAVNTKDMLVKVKNFDALHFAAEALLKHPNLFDILLVILEKANKKITPSNFEMLFNQLNDLIDKVDDATLNRALVDVELKSIYEYSQEYKNTRLGKKLIIKETQDTLRGWLEDPVINEQSYKLMCPSIINNLSFLARFSSGPCSFYKDYLQHACSPLLNHTNKILTVTIAHALRNAATTSSETLYQALLRVTDELSSR